MPHIKFLDYSFKGKSILWIEVTSMDLPLKRALALYDTALK